MFWHKERQLCLLLYVDDILADGNEEDVDWIFKLLGDRFETKEEEVLRPGSVIDYLGLHLVLDEEGRISIHPPQVFVQLRDMMMVDIGFQSK